MIRNSIISRFKLANRIISFILLVSACVLFTMCKRSSKDEVALGGENKFASSNFFVYQGPSGYFVPFINSSKKLPLSTPTGSPYTAKANIIAFSANKLFFAAKLSEVVSWNISIVGLTSGATKVISGISDSINSSNSLWDGAPTDAPFFIKNELLVAKLTIAGSTISYVDTINTTRVKNYNNKTENGVKITVLDDFESDVSVAGAFPFSAFYPDAVDANAITLPSDSFRVSGSRSAYMKGFDANGNTYLGVKSTANNNNNFNIKETDPSKIFFNLYVYGTGAENAALTLALYENEHVKQGLSYNNQADDSWTIDVFITWKGWKLVSIPYSAFKKASDPLYGGNGNGVKEPSLISGAAISLGSLPVALQTVDAYMDLVTITEGGPFKP